MIDSFGMLILPVVSATTISTTALAEVPSTRYHLLVDLPTLLPLLLLLRVTKRVNRRVLGHEDKPVDMLRNVLGLRVTSGLRAATLTVKATHELFISILLVPQASAPIIIDISARIEPAPRRCNFKIELRLFSSMDRLPPAVRSVIITY
ncbi:unnamed protein product [Nezara viridula]|uniref:Uncharacterized protein n=1 Tax=Nezara viridula TaxID=85310 RepID=A0A9P0HF49_NEZVI|nr:unnamed protein product [Nezara viridula]